MCKPNWYCKGFASLQCDKELCANQIYIAKVLHLFNVISNCVQTKLVLQMFLGKNSCRLSFTSSETVATVRLLLSSQDQVALSPFWGWSSGHIWLFGGIQSQKSLLLSTFSLPCHPICVHKDNWFCTRTACSIGLRRTLPLSWPLCPHLDFPCNRSKGET